MRRPPGFSQNAIVRGKVERLGRGTKTTCLVLSGAQACGTANQLAPAPNDERKQGNSFLERVSLPMLLRKDEKTMTTEAVQEPQQSWMQTPPATPPLRHAIAQVAEKQTWLDRLAKPCQHWILQLFGQPG